MKVVVLLYSADQWLSRSSMNLIAVCSTKEVLVKNALKFAKDVFGCTSLNDLGDDDDRDDDKDYLEDIENALWTDGEFLGHGFGFYVEWVEIDELYE